MKTILFSRNTPLFVFKNKFLANQKTYAEKNIKFNDFTANYTQQLSDLRFYAESKDILNNSQNDLDELIAQEVLYDIAQVLHDVQPDDFYYYFDDHRKISVSGKTPSFKRWMETTRRILIRSQKNVLLLINNLKSSLNGLLAGESSGNWLRLVGAIRESPLLLYTYYGTVLAMWLFRFFGNRAMWKSWF